MDILLKTTLIGLFFGTFGTLIGGIIGVTCKTTSNKVLSFILSLASGIMISVVCFDLVPEALELSGLSNVIIGIITGVISMILCDELIQKKFNKNKRNSKDKSSLLKTGIIVSIGLALHNFPEGLAIGSSFGASIRLGYSLALAICLHDIPEGISMAIPMKNGGMKTSRTIMYVLLSGITTGIGAFFGALIGGVSQKIIALCLSFAAGAMLYIVSGELIPESNKLYKGRMSGIGHITGFLLGILATSI